MDDGNLAPVDVDRRLSDEHVVEATSDRFQPVVQLSRRLDIHVDAVDVMRSVNQPQQPLGLFHVFVRQQTERYRELSFVVSDVFW